MKKRKVLFVVHQLNHGGVQKSLLTALNAIDYTQNEVTLYVRKNRTQLLDMVNPNVQQIIINDDKTHYYRKPYMIYLQICKKLCELLKDNKKRDDIRKKIATYLNQEKMKYEIAQYAELQESYDVAISYIQGYTAKFVSQYIDAKKKVMFFHGSIDENHELHEEIMPCFDSIVGVNKNVQQLLQSLYPTCSDKMTYIENYVDPEEIREKAKASTIQKDINRIVLCSCGRLALVKGFDLAVEAANELQNAGVDFLWYFVGDGPERAKLEQLIEAYQLNDKIIITGMQANPYPYIANCDIYVQPSYEEAQPLAIIEAMILERPVITTATIGGMSLVKNQITGLIVGINAHELGNGILYLQKNKLLVEKLIRESRNLDYSIMHQEYHNQWKNLLEG